MYGTIAWLNLISFGGVMVSVITTLLPVFITIGIGVLLRKTRLIQPESVQDLKKLVVNVALPAVLFTSFLSTELSASYAALAVIIFFLNLALYLLGVAAKRFFPLLGDRFPLTMTGFEFGMMGAVFFGAAFGMENFAYFAVIGIGHELFIWFVYVALIKRSAGEKQSLPGTLRSFIKSPLIIAVVSSIVLNVTGLADLLLEIEIFSSIMQTLTWLAGLVIPLILIVLGYELIFTKETVKTAAGPVLFRFAVMVAAAFFMVKVVLGPLLGLDGLYVPAMYTFFLLPPPFILAVFLPEKSRKGINSFLVLYSVLSLAAFSVYYLLYSL